jgi:putative endonuclease
MRWFKRLQLWWRKLNKPLSLGQLGEREAARFLKSQGMHIVARGNRARLGEIDLVAVDKRTLVFV